MTKPKAYEERLRAFIATATSWEQAYIRRWDSSASIAEFPQAMWGDRDCIEVGGGRVACECCGTKRLKVLYAVVPDGDVARVQFIGHDCLAHLLDRGAAPLRGARSPLVPGPGPQEDSHDSVVIRQAQDEAYDAPVHASPSSLALSTEDIKGERSEAMIAPEPLTFDPAPFNPALAPIEIVFDWLCQHMPGLRDSGGIGIPPHDKAGPLTYCEATLYHLVGEALSLRPVWSTAALSEYPVLDICEVQVDIFAGYMSFSGIALSGQGTVRCVWGDTSRMPAKEARLRAAADMMLKQEKGETPC